MSLSGDRVDAYLDDLLQELRVDRRRVRRILPEVEDHLREGIQQGIAGGLDPDAAERQAVAAFGSPRTVARRFAAEEGRLLPPSMLLQLVLALGLVAGIGLVGIGGSGALSAGFGAAFGKSFVSGDTNGVTYTPARCADFQSYFPDAPDCEAAATAHHFEEIVSYRLAAGVLGLLVLAGYIVLYRRFPRGAGVRLLPDGLSSGIGAALFGVAAALLFLQSLSNFTVEHTTGAGGPLSGGIISAVLFAAFAVSLLRTLSARVARG